MAHFRSRRTKKGVRKWEAQVRIGINSVTGKSIDVSKTFDSKPDAKHWADKMEIDKREGTFRPTQNRLTFGEYITKEWLPRYRVGVRKKSKERRRQSTLYNLECVVGKWILRQQPNTPFLGDVQLSKLNHSHFDKLYVAMTEKRGEGKANQPVRFRAIEFLHGILKRALKSAVEKGELPRNPAALATLPGDAEQEGREDADVAASLSREQAQRFLRAAQMHRWSALWHLLLDAGVRPGEAFALKWEHVEPLDGGFVKVRNNLTRTGVKGWKLTALKTKTSKRDVPISPRTVQQLKLWKGRQNVERQNAGAEWQEHGFVFTTELGTPLGNNVHIQFGRLLGEADKGGDLGEWGPVPERTNKPGRPAQPRFKGKFVLYVLRHTSATLALTDPIKPVSLLEVSRRLGHTDLAFTARTYGHLKAEDTRAAADSFDRLAASIG